MDPSLKVAERSARRGLAWISEAFALFREQPLAWIALSMSWVLIWFALLMLPILGLVVTCLLQPVFFASFAIAAYKQSAGERLRVAELFSGFRHNVRSLVNIGFVMLVVQLGALLIMNMLGLPHELDLRAYEEVVRQNGWILLIGLAITTTASGILWFAPQLIVFHGMPASHAIRWSVYAGLANLGALLAYGAMLMLLMVVAWLPFGLGMLVLLPVLVISTYTSYRDVFELRSGADSGTPPEL